MLKASSLKMHSRDSITDSSFCVLAVKCSQCPKQAESLVERQRAHTNMLPARVHLQDIKMTTLKERENLFAKAKKASEKHGVENGAEKVSA